MTECCSPIFSSTLDRDEAARLAGRFKALADPGRLRLLSLIAQCGEVCGCDPAEPLGLSQPTVSHHLKVLFEAGLVERERRGKWIHYRIAPEAIAETADVLRVVPQPVDA